MLYFIAAVLITFSFIYPSRKWVTYSNLLFMWALFAFNTANADYNNYVRIYARIGSGDLFSTTVQEPGYIYLAYFSNHFLKLNYAQFLILVAAIATVLLAIVLQLYLNWNNQNIVLALFLILNYWVMICQYRTYIAILFSLIGLFFLLNDKTRRGPILFVLFVLLGSLFHIAVLIFLLFILVRWWKLSYVIALVPIMIVGVLLLRTEPISNLLTIFISNYKMRWLYGTSTRTVVGIITLIIIRLALLIIEYYTYKRDSQKLLGNDQTLRLENFIIKVTAVSLSFIALEVYFEEFERLFRLVLILSFIFYALHLKNEHVKAKNIPITNLCFIVFFIGYLIYFYIGHNAWFSSVFIPVFTQNSLLNIFML